LIDEFRDIIQRWWLGWNGSLKYEIGRAVSVWELFRMNRKMEGTRNTLSHTFSSTAFLEVLVSSFLVAGDAASSLFFLRRNETLKLIYTSNQSSSESAIV
jgi:hypothetical protein